MTPTASAVVVTLAEGTYAGTYLLLPSGNDFVYADSGGASLTFSATSGAWVLTYADALEQTDVWTATTRTINPPAGDDSLVYTNSDNDTHDVLSSVQSYGNVRTDNFNRANSSSSLGTPSDGGAAWITESGTWGIDSNQEFHVTGSQSVAVLSGGPADSLIQVTLPIIPTDSGLAFRVTDDNNYFTLVVVSGAGQFSIFKRNAGSFSLPARISGVTFANGDTISVICSGTSIQCFLNGLMVMSATDSFNQTATLAGIRCNGDADTTMRGDNFSIQQAVADVLVPSGAVLLGASNIEIPGAVRIGRGINV